MLVIVNAAPSMLSLSLAQREHRFPRDIMLRPLGRGNGKSHTLLKFKASSLLPTDPDTSLTLIRKQMQPERSVSNAATCLMLQQERTPSVASSTPASAT